MIAGRRFAEKTTLNIVFIIVHQLYLACSIVNRLCSVTNPKYKPHIYLSILVIKIGYYRFTMIQLLSLTK